VVHYETILVEAEKRCPGERDLLAALGPTRPPLNRTSIAARHGFAEPALDVLLFAEGLRQVGTNSIRTLIGVAERVCGVTSVLRI